jgi:hypothetical protein
MQQQQQGSDAVTQQWRDNVTTQQRSDAATTWQQNCTSSTFANVGAPSRCSSNNAHNCISKIASTTA